MNNNATLLSFVESAVVDAPISSVWPFIKLTEFPKCYKAILNIEKLPTVGDERETVNWYMDDGTILTLREEEYSALTNSMSFNIIKCEPWKLPYTGALSTIRLYPITSGLAQDKTFVEWEGHYSSEASFDIIQDARLKRREGLADLNNFLKVQTDCRDEDATAQRANLIPAIVSQSSIGGSK